MNVCVAGMHACASPPALLPDVSMSLARINFAPRNGVSPGSVNTARYWLDVLLDQSPQETSAKACAGCGR
jgi:hypothetical protein